MRSPQQSGIPQRGKIAFRQSDLKRAMKAALDAGMSWARVKTNSDGTFEISAGINAAAEPAPTDLDKWIKDHAGSA